MAADWRVKLYMGVESRVGDDGHGTPDAALEEAVRVEEALGRVGLHTVSVGIVNIGEEGQNGGAEKDKNDVG